ncbi:acetyl-CoA carboxylase biotin carboxyl carrier protein [Bacillus sp. FJAT-49736]|uniref:acetyl-CoA carboxylase biotin carboxyl carrier protein n=1 Tax=Bacillus sp. FJAT-49736 TaxID=2833582 RepID=UPI001BC94451|nr:acetyl-CoA carboxylase biotin carboxyl carrier protein [Bacillus sp. FJAT-49736]MBS4173422.1 acetyl-CoA carboxylase biotin carboxyl carrier protein [Bacillus sp. FJAT-49736]
MFKIQEIREIIKLVDQSSIDEFEFESEGSTLKMKKNSGVAVVESQVITQPVQQPVVQSVPQVAAAAPIENAITNRIESKVEAAPVQDTNLHKIVSPMVGTFYQSPSPDKDAYVKVGSQVKSDSIVCIVEAMKLFNEIEAEVDGEIVEVLAKDGQLVEYGQPLFLVKTK